MEQLIAIGKRLSISKNKQSIFTFNYIQELEIIESMATLKKLFDEKNYSRLTELIKIADAEKTSEIEEESEEETVLITALIKAPENIIVYALSRMLEGEKPEDLENQLALRFESAGLSRGNENIFWLGAAGCQMIAEGKRLSTIEHTLFSVLPAWLEKIYYSGTWRKNAEEEKATVEEDYTLDEPEVSFPSGFFTSSSISPQRSLILACMNESFANLGDEALCDLVINLEPEELATVLWPLDGENRLRIQNILGEEQTKAILPYWNTSLHRVQSAKGFIEIEEKVGKVLEGKLPGIF